MIAFAESRKAVQWVFVWVCDESAKNVSETSNCGGRPVRQTAKRSREAKTITAVDLGSARRPRNFISPFVFVRTRLFRVLADANLRWLHAQSLAQLTLRPSKTGRDVVLANRPFLQFRTLKTSVVIGFSSVRKTWPQQYLYAAAVV
jgi:hypothetical protein